MAFRRASTGPLPSEICRSFCLEDQTQAHVLDNSGLIVPERVKDLLPCLTASELELNKSSRSSFSWLIFMVSGALMIFNLTCTPETPSILS